MVSSDCPSDSGLSRKSVAGFDSWKQRSSRRNWAYERRCGRRTAQVALVGGLAHDLRNALLVIRGYDALLKPGLAPDQLRDVEEIEKATERATELIAGLLDVARRYCAPSSPRGGAAFAPSSAWSPPATRMTSTPPYSGETCRSSKSSMLMPDGAERLRDAREHARLVRDAHADAVQHASPRCGRRTRACALRAVAASAIHRLDRMRARRRAARARRRRARSPMRSERVDAIRSPLSTKMSAQTAAFAPATRVISRSDAPA